MLPRRPGVAAFDFDGTVSSRDNVVPFMRAVLGTGPMLRAVALTGPKLVAASLVDARRNDAKDAMLHRTFAGREVDAVAAIARDFADDVVAHHLNTAIVARLRWHQGQGHRVVLVSASLDAYLGAVGHRLGVDAALATELATEHGAYTGAIAGANVRRAEKVARLDAWLEATALTTAEVWAYGDSRGDDELLARADHAFRVRRGALRRN